MANENQTREIMNIVWVGHHQSIFTIICVVPIRFINNMHDITSGVNHSSVTAPFPDHILPTEMR